MHEHALPVENNYSVRLPNSVNSNDETDSHQLGYAVDPLVRYPPLLDLVLEKIQTSSIKSQQCMLVKLLGIIGAVDPFRYKVTFHSFSSVTTLRVTTI